MLKIALGITFILSVSLLGVMACSEEAPAPATPPTTAPANAQPTPTAAPPTEAAAQTRPLTPEPTTAAHPTSAPTPEPAATSTLEPTAAPEPTPTTAPTSTPRPTPTPQATPTPSPTPTPLPAVSFPWLDDGVTEDERRAVNALRNILQEAPAVAETLLSFSWFADGVTKDEALAVYHLQVILREDPAIAKTLLGFSWFPDGVTKDEMNALYNLREILREDAATAKTLMVFPWLADDVTGDESYAIYDLREILREDPAMANTLMGFPLLSDGVTETERRTLRGLRNLYELDRSSLSALTQKSWFKDGISDEEFMLVGDLGEIARRSETHFLAIVDMPFLETFEPADALAARSLRRLACCGEGVSKEFRWLMAHPAISDGISDEEAVVVATLHGARSFYTDLFDPLLDPNTVALEERTIDLPHTGETQLTVIRIRPGAERTMDLLERAVRTVEGFATMPFPVKHVIFLAENTHTRRYGASHHGTSMSGWHDKYDTDEYPEIDVLHVLAHETSHYYWNRDWNRHWIEDGLGAFFQSFIMRQASLGPGVPVVPIWPPKMAPCPYMTSIAERDRELDRPGVRVISDCSDSLGDRLFQDLWRGLGDPVFRQGLGNLYLMARSGAPVGECEFRKYDKAGICEVEAAFKAAAPGDAAAIVDTVIGRWFDNSEPYDLSHVDTSPPNPNLPGGVEITRAYISLDRDRPEDDQDGPLFGQRDTGQGSSDSPFLLAHGLANAATPAHVRDVL